MAISCKLNQSVLKTNSCGYALNSVKDLYFANREDIAEIKYDEQGAVTAVTLNESAKWSRIMPAEGSASYTDALGVIDGGGKYRTQTVSFRIASEYTTEMVDVLNALSLGEFVIVATLASGTFVLLGSEAVGLTANTANNVGAGSATEFSGMEFEMSGDLTVASAPLTEQAITALKANVND